MLKTKEGKSIFIANKGFTAVPNELLLDKNISNNAKLLYIYIAQINGINIKHDYQKELIRMRCKYGRDKLNNSLLELVNSGWLKRKEEKISNKIFRYIYELVYSR